MMDPIIIGQADGPTSVFLAGKLGGGWINLFGLCIVIAILIPNIVYAIKFKGAENKCTNKVMNVLEQIGRYGCMLLLVLDIGQDGFGFSSVAAFLAYICGNAVLVLAYWIVWVLYFVKQSRWKSMALAIIPAVIFWLSGITLQYILLVIATLIFAVGHIYVTWQNVK